MKVGMLWFDNDPKRSLEDKVERAAQYYREKYGVAPNLCYAHPRTVGDEPQAQKVQVGLTGATRPAHQVTLKQARSILPNHFWLGVGE
ncbi:MAG: hypothetical protein HY259_15330 [Chloroflexi bacterium]|nr:hypothetical protein [Chloroflexota bacterium]